MATKKGAHPHGPAGELRDRQRREREERRAKDRQRRKPEEIVLKKCTKTAQRLIEMGRQRDAEVVLAASVLVADILAAEFGRAPHADAGLVWDNGQARYVPVVRPEPLRAGAVETTVVETRVTNADGSEWVLENVLEVSETAASDATSPDSPTALHPIPGPDAMTPVLEPRPTEAEHHQIGCCVEETTCTKCGLGCCPVHDELVEYCDDGPHHFGDEQGACLSCTVIARDDYADDMAVERWKEGRA